MHELTRGAGVTVALIDTGVDAKHPDLAGAVLPGVNLLPRATDDGRKDLEGHGTTMAGIIAARGRGRENGVLGIAPAAKILPITGAIDGFGTSDFMTEAVAFAKERGARVINMSFSAGDDRVLHDAIRAAQAADMVLVAGAGNRSDVGNGFPGK